MATRVTKDFYARDSIDVARELLGMCLVHRLKDGTRLDGVIVETEAYLGIHDPAAHSFGGRRTPRTDVMFGEPGFSYVYFIYGMYFCFNVVTATKDVPEAILIRALEPCAGLNIMQKEFPAASPHRLANGPGKLCRALQLNRSHSALDLTSHASVWIEGASSDALIVEGPRVGIGYAHDAVHWPLRFGLKDHPALSMPKFPP